MWQRDRPTHNEIQSLNIFYKLRAPFAESSNSSSWQNPVKNTICSCNTRSGSANSRAQGSAASRSSALPAAGERKGPAAARPSQMIGTGKKARLESLRCQLILVLHWTLLGEGEAIRPAEGETTPRLQNSIKIQDTHEGVESSYPAGNPDQAEDAPQHGHSHQRH